MNGNDLKGMIKALVRECVDEILAEKYIKLHEQKTVPAAKPTIKENKEVAAIKQELKKDVLKSLGIDEGDDAYSIFLDTARKTESVNPKTQKGEHESVSEAQMEEAGFMQKDWEKYF